MKEIILVKTGEIALKGLNKATFEDILVKNIRRKLKGMGEISIKKSQSTLVIDPKDESCDLSIICDKLSTVFGIATFSRCLVTKKDMDTIRKDAVSYLKDTLKSYSTFKVNAKRSDKQFPLTSPEIMMEIGGDILQDNPHLKVDVHNPAITVTVEVRDVAAYVHAKVYQGAKGMPVGSSGRALLMISGGIDSPVAGHMMAKRGIQLSAVHFVSPPYTSGLAQQKVETLCELMGDYCGSIRFFCVNFTKIQEAIKKHCPDDLFTVIMRRIMMKISIMIAKREDLLALITGESLGQVASQTINAIAATDAVCDIPVLRPLIGMDKNEIIEIARRINTFETSVLPYEDCCTVFTPKHPRTRPPMELVVQGEAMYDFTDLIEEAIATTEIKMIHPNM